MRPADVVVRVVSADRPRFLVLVLALTFAVFALSTRDFATLYNTFNMTQYGVEIGLLALGETLVIISGGGSIDLSVGSMLSLSGVVLGMLTMWARVDVWTATLLGILSGGALGALNALLITRVGIPALIVTLGTLYAYGSAALVLTDTVPISGLPAAFFVLGQGRVLGVPLQVLAVFLPVALALHFLLRYTVFGRALYGVGTNEVAARFAAINVRGVRFWVFTLSGVLAGLAAAVMTSRVASARPDAGMGFELQAITIAVLGGTLITGGEGTILGTILGVLVITVLSNGLQLAGVHPIWQLGAVGVVLVATVLLNQWLLRHRVVSWSPGTMPPA
jgi:ribose/xylose/arabinose/galactoside ABC-type transport system permease subunit